MQGPLNVKCNCVVYMEPKEHVVSSQPVRSPEHYLQNNFLRIFE